MAVDRGIVQVNEDTAAGIIRQLQTWVEVDGDPVGIIGCPVDPHPPNVPPHIGATMATGESWITIGGISVCFQGHLASCGHACTGQTWIGIDD